MMQVLIVLATAILSSVFTLGAAWLIYRHRLEALVRATVERETDRIAELLKQKVREGAVEAGQQLLPDFRREVREGFREALTVAPGAELVEKVARTGSSIVDSGLSALLGKKRR